MPSLGALHVFLQNRMFKLPFQTIFSFQSTMIHRQIVLTDAPVSQFRLQFLPVPP